jgi:hypothetical protein
VTDIVLRNPWATDGHTSFSAFKKAAGGSNDGLITVSISQLFKSGGRLDWGNVA